jgi:hypothetical protein
MPLHLERRPRFECEQIVPWLARGNVRNPFQRFLPPGPAYGRARSSVRFAVAWFVGCGLLVSSVSTGEETADDSAKNGQSHEVGQGITIVQAQYGSWEQFNAGNVTDVTEKTRRYITGGKLHIPHTRQAFGDPHPYKGKVFRMSYLLDGKNSPTGKPHLFQHKAGEITFDPTTTRPLSAAGIRHVFQGKGTNFCVTASCIMVAQRMTSLDLREDLIESIAGLQSSVSATRKGLGSMALASSLGMDMKWIFYDTGNDQGITAEEFALQKLKEVVIPELSRGNIVNLSIHRGGSNTHAILLTAFDDKEQTFDVHDSIVTTGLVQIKISEIAKWWPIGPEDDLWVRGFIFSPPPARSGGLLVPPLGSELGIQVDALNGMILPGDIKFPRNQLEYDTKKFFDAMPGAKIAHVSYGWEPGRKADEVSGIPLWLKIKAAAGDPVCLFWDDGEGSKRVVAVTGYRGGYKNFDGELRITWVGEGNELAHSWVTGAEVLQKGKTQRDCGGDGFYIIYPKKPLAAEVKTSEETNKN